MMPTYQRYDGQPAPVLAGSNTSRLLLSGTAVMGMLVGTVAVTSSSSSSSSLWTVTPAATVVTTQPTVLPTARPFNAPAGFRTRTAQAAMPYQAADMEALSRDPLSYTTSASAEPMARPSLLSWAALLLGVSAIVYVGHKALPVHTPTPLSMVAVTGEKAGASSFDPLNLANPAAPRDLSLTHGKLALAAAVGTLLGSVVAGGPALAEGIDFGFNYDFEVDFEGFKVDHRILVDLIVTGQAIGFLGAVTSGLYASARKQDIEELSTKLRKVNQQLVLQQRRKRSPVVVDEPPEAPEVVDVIAMLKVGKTQLKDGDAEAACATFNKAIELINQTDQLRCPLRAKRRAYFGLGTAFIRLGKFEDALEAMLTVLSLCAEIGDEAGLMDAYGSIADIYTEMQQMVKAGQYYDLYIEALNGEMERS